MNEVFGTNGTGIATKMAMAAVAPKTNVTDFPLPEPMEVPEETAPISFWKRQLYFGGILTMSGSQPKPPGFYVNLQTIALIVAIAGSILGGFYWTWQRAIEKGIEIGVTQTEKKQLEERLQNLEKEKILNDKIKEQEAKNKGVK